MADRITVGGYLRGWGFSPQPPQRRALEQNPAAVAGWLAEEFLAIRAQAKREGRVVLWLDEMGALGCGHRRSWAPVGQTAVVKETGKRFRVNMISAISNAGTAGRGSTACRGRPRRPGPWVKLVTEGIPVMPARRLPSMLREFPAELRGLTVGDLADQARVRFHAAS